MPLSKSQVKLVHAAKTACKLDDAEYRAIWGELFEGITSSKDTALGDEHFDKFMKYLEAIYWRKPESAPCKVFQYPNYWKEKNERGNTSRDRHALATVQSDCKALEKDLMAMGFTYGYCNAISKRVLGSNPDVNTWYRYRGALSRTLASKRQKQKEEACNPF